MPSMNIFTVIFTQPLTNGLILFYQVLWNNLGLAIVGFSLFLTFLTKPLSKPQMDTMKKIKEIEPLVSKLKKKYGDDKMGFSKAQAELYRQKGINPGAGCLPQILQIVILYALFGVFTTVLSGTPESMQKLNSLLYKPMQMEIGESLNTKFLYLDIAKPDVFNIAGIPFALPGAVLILATIAQFISVKVNAPGIKKEEKAAGATKSEADDMQVAMSKSMTYTLPLMTIFFGMKFPSGLALYWFVFSVVNVFNQVRSSGWGGLTPAVNLVKSKLNLK